MKANHGHRIVHPGENRLMKKTIALGSNMRNNTVGEGPRTADLPRVRFHDERKEFWRPGKNRLDSVEGEVIMKALAIVVLFLALSACAEGGGPRYFQAGKTDADIDQAKLDCRKESTPAGRNSVTKEQQSFQSCMSSKGYVLIQ